MNKFHLNFRALKHLMETMDDRLLVLCHGGLPMMYEVGLRGNFVDLYCSSELMFLVLLQAKPTGTLSNPFVKILLCAREVGSPLKATTHARARPPVPFSLLKGGLFPL